MATKDEGIAEGYLSACEQENRELRVEVERLRAALSDYVARHGCSHSVRCWAAEYAQGVIGGAKADRVTGVTL